MKPAKSCEHSIPSALRPVFESQLDDLNGEERRLLEVCSVAGLEFSSALVAEVLENDLIKVEECCETLVRRHLFLEPGGMPARPERREAGRYRFAHSFYRSLLYERLSQAKRRQLHSSIGVCKVRAYGERAVEVAAELAVHFEEGRDYPHAVHYLDVAAELAMQRKTPHEVLAYLHRALRLLDTLPKSPERAKLSRNIHRALQHPLLQSSLMDART